MPDITAHIRVEIARRDMAVHMIAQRMNMATSSWYRRMADPLVWRIGELVALAEILRVPLDVLIFGRDR